MIGWVGEGPPNGQADIGWRPVAWLVEELTQGRTKEIVMYEYTAREQRAGWQSGEDCHEAVVGAGYVGR